MGAGSSAVLLWQREKASLRGGVRNPAPKKEDKKEPNCVAASPRQRSSQIKGPEAGAGMDCLRNKTA